ncbi:MAG: hypothetical protein ABJZ56_15335 [Paracoccaceae bacterium]
MEDARTGAIDREIALSYVRNAQAYEQMLPSDLERIFPAVLDAVGYLDVPSESALELIAQLLKRHGKGISDTLRDAIAKHDIDNFVEGSLPRLYGDAQRRVSLPAIERPGPSSFADKPHATTIGIDVLKRRVAIADRIVIERNATADVLIELAQVWLESAGRGLNPLDYSCLTAPDLAQLLGVDSDEVVRRRINRARAVLKQRFESSNLETSAGDLMIENIPWQGYRFAPELVTIRMIEPSN